jgi:hypothetical protein
MPIKPMDQALVLDYVEGRKDTVSERVQEDLEYFNSRQCPRCGGGCRAEPDVQRMIRAGTTMTMYHCRCLECGCLFDPSLGLIVEMGNLARVRPTIPTIYPKED